MTILIRALNLGMLNATSSVIANFQGYLSPWKSTDERKGIRKGSSNYPGKNQE